MSNLEQAAVDEIARKCIETYMKLDKSGKPVDEEWTVLTCVIEYNMITATFDVVSLGTGSKCIGATKMSPKGDLLNDSHAEVLARRGFLVYLYENMENALDQRPSIFSLESNKFKLKEGVEFVLYSSQLPCGDASIMPKCYDECDVGDVITSNKRQAEENICDTDHKTVKVSDIDIHRTGAKCLPNSTQDSKCPGMNYHLLGQVRTKPGRGDRTLSVSCSDKMAKWVHVGIQGGLIDMLLDRPIYIKSFIFGGGVPYFEESIKRAFLSRTSDVTIVALENLPQIHQSSVIFPHVRNESNKRPAAGSIVWIKLNNIVHQVAVQGRKLGLTKKKASLPGNSLCVSKYNLYKRFHEILIKNEPLHNEICIKNIETIPYNEMKRKSQEHLGRWREVKDNFFKIWTVKPDIFNFCVNLT